MNAGYYTEVYDSIKDIDPNEWQSLIDASQDLAMDPRLIHLMEKTLHNQARFWTVLVRDRQKQLIACACLSLFQTDIVQSASGFLRKWVERLRSYWPNALKLKVLFCGLPSPAAHSHFRARASVDLQSVLQVLNEAMSAIASREKAALVVLKELDTGQDEQVSNLQNLGFVRGELEPLYQLSGAFKDFDDYRAALRSTYRNQIRANIKKFKQSGLKVEHLLDSEEIYSRFNESVYQLYLNVWKKAKEKLECYSLDFFREIAKAVPNQVIFTLVTDAGKPVAFALGLMGEEHYYNLYVGLDYSYNDETDLYFNLFYHELDAVFKMNKKTIFLGQTSGMFKSRLGAFPDPRYFWVRPLNPILRILFKHLQSVIFPKVNLIKANQVFRTVAS